MKNKLPYVSLVGIILFLMLLFPFTRSWLAGFFDGFVDKKDNVVEEYERVRGEIDSFTDSVGEAQEQFEETVNTVNQTAEDVKTMKEQLDEFKEMTGQ